VKRLVAIEDLGSIEILFTDKTGTLTEGAITFDRAPDASGQVGGRCRGGDARLCRRLVRWRVRSMDVKRYVTDILDRLINAVNGRLDLPGRGVTIHQPARRLKIQSRQQQSLHHDVAHGSGNPDAVTREVQRYGSARN
jgi:magnesium-transporting ATPase (P-type)